jgi:hypothetical protein
VGLKVEGVDGGELANDDNAVRSCRKGWSLCDKQRGSKEVFDYSSKEATETQFAPGYHREIVV